MVRTELYWIDGTYAHFMYIHGIVLLYRAEQNTPSDLLLLM